MKQKCLVCGVNADSAYCFRHKTRKAFPKKSTKWGITYNSMTPEELQRTIAMRGVFLEIWKKRRHVSEISGQSLGSEPLTVFFHHILPKNKYPQAQYDEENIILLTLEEHDNVEADMYKYVKINYLREKLLLKYNL